MENCDLRKGDRCTKYGKNYRDDYPLCRPSSILDCEDQAKVIEPNEMCRKGSIFGNEYYYITEEQLKQLKNGKVIMCNINGGEYMCFVALKRGEL